MLIAHCHRCVNYSSAALMYLHALEYSVCGYFNNFYLQSARIYVRRLVAR